MILVLLFLASVLLVFFAFPDWPVAAILLAPLALVLGVWLVRLLWRRLKRVVVRPR